MDARRREKIGERVGGINKLVPKEQHLDAERVKSIAQDRKYDKTFYRSLSRIEGRARDGIPIDGAYQLLATGKEPKAYEQQQQQQMAQTTLRAVQQLIRSGSGREERTENLAQKKGRKSNELDIEM
jgi:hypothetical protein